MLKLKVKKLRDDAIIPEYKTEHSSGLDLHSVDDTVINIGELVLISTGISVEIPYGYEGQIRPRSGIASKYGITIINTPGTIDSDYRGEIKLALINLGKQSFKINKGDRLAQLVIAPVERCNVVVVDELSETVRGENGFGSTGISKDKPYSNVVKVNPYSEDTSIITIPEEITEKLGLKEGSIVDVEVVNGILKITPISDESISEVL